MGLHRENNANQQHGAGVSTGLGSPVGAFRVAVDGGSFSGVRSFCGKEGMRASPWQRCPGLLLYPCQPEGLKAFTYHLSLTVEHFEFDSSTGGTLKAANIAWQPVESGFSWIIDFNERL